MERQWDTRLDKLGVHVEAPASAVYRLVKASWLSNAEAGDKHHIYVRVLDEHGGPLQDYPFRVTNGGVRVERTKGPGFDDYYGNFPMFAGGRYAVDIPDTTSDKVTGLGMGITGDPFANTCFYLIFQRGAETTESESQPQSGGGEKLDEATRKQLLALLDKAQAELDAARALLEVK